MRILRQPLDFLTQAPRRLHAVWVEQQLRVTLRRAVVAVGGRWMRPTDGYARTVIASGAKRKRGK